MEGKFCRREKVSEANEKLNFFFMPPSFTCVIKVKSRTFVKQAVQKLNLVHRDERLEQAFAGVPQSGLNHILFRCEHEERDVSAGLRGTYGLQKSGQFVYAGITSFVHLLNQLKLSRDMGAEVFDNIRAGDWLMDCVVDRLSAYHRQEPSIGLAKLAEWLEEYFASIKLLPAHMKPRHVSRVIEALHQ